MEVEKAVSAAANLDTVVLTAKVGVAAAALKAGYDGLSHLPDALKLVAGAAVVGLALALAARLARGGQQAAPAPAMAAEQQEAAGSGSGGGEAGAGAVEREKASVGGG